MHIPFAVTDHQATVVQCRRSQQTVQQIALRPQRHTAFGAQRQQAIVLVNHIDAITVNDEIIHRAQLTFPHDLAAAQIQRGQVAVIGQSVHHTVNDNGRSVYVAQTVNFR